MNAQKSTDYTLTGAHGIDKDFANNLVHASGILDRFFEIAGSENVAKIHFDRISEKEYVLTTKFGEETITVEADAVPEEKDEDQHWAEKDGCIGLHQSFHRISEAVETLGGIEKIKEAFGIMGGAGGIATAIEQMAGSFSKKDISSIHSSDTQVTMKPERDRRIIEEVKGDKVVFTNIPKNENFDAGMAYFGGQKTGRFSFEVPKENLDLARRAVRSILGMNTWSHVRAPYGNKAELVENRS